MFALDTASAIEEFEALVSDDFATEDAVAHEGGQRFEGMPSSDTVWTHWGTSEPDTTHRCVTIDEDTQAWKTASCDSYNMFFCEVYAYSKYS